MRLAPAIVASVVVGIAGACSNSVPLRGLTVDGGAEPPNDAATADAEPALPDDAASADADAGADADAAAVSLCPKRSNQAAPAPFKIAPPDVNGSRIRALYINGADGSRTLWKLHDNGLGVDCDYLWWYHPKGQPDRCRPAVNSSYPFRYSGPDCTVVAWPVQRGAPPPPFVGARVTGSGYEKKNGVCGLAPFYIYADFYEPPAPIADSAMVTFAPSAPTGAPGEAIVDMGSDGSSFWFGDVATYGQYGDPSAGRIFPRRGAGPGGRSFPGTTQEPCDEPPDLVQSGNPAHYPPAGSGRVATYLGGSTPAPYTLLPFVGSYWSEGPQGFCSKQVAINRFTLLEACSPDEFVSAAFVPPTARLGRPTWAFGPAGVLAPYPDTRAINLDVTDTTPGYAGYCAPRIASDGVLRCMPSIGMTYHYADAACTQPVRVGNAAAPLGTRNASWAQGVYSIHAVTGPLVPTELFYLDGETCSSAPVPAGQVFDLLADEVPPSNYVAVTVTE